MEESMAELGDISELKARVREQRDAGDPAGAAGVLRDAIRRIGLELADLHGMLGGTLSEQGDFAAAVAEYDAGFELDRRFGSPSSYNELNRLVARVRVAPGSLAGASPATGPGRELPAVDVPRELAGVETRLRSEVGAARAADPWAAGDLALAAALNGHLAEALAAADRVAAQVRGAYARTLAALAALDTPRKATLEAVRARLEQAPG
jgi:hypothetical protein